MFMKYKRISTKDYLVNEDQFIDLLENKARRMVFKKYKSKFFNI